MSERVNKAGSILSIVSLAVLIIAEQMAYDYSSIMSRAFLIMTFLGIAAALMWNIAHQRYDLKWTILFIMVLGSLYFSLVRSSFLSLDFAHTRLSSETYVTAQQYSLEGNLAFESLHSYFFALPLILSIMSSICGISLSAMVYIWVLIYVCLVALISFLLVRAIMSRIGSNAKFSKTSFILPSSIALLVISFSYSERQHIFLVLSMLAMYLFIQKGQDAGSRSYPVTMLVLIFAIAIGNATGSLWLIPFFFLFSILSNRRNILYALIPIAYLLFSAYSYTLSIARYAEFALAGFLDFIQQLIGGQSSERILPWERVSSMPAGDVYISSAAYLCLIMLSLTMVVISTYVLVKKRGVVTHGESVLVSSNLLCLLLFTGIAAVGYVGASFRPETTISDIRTIAMVFLSLCLPFTFLSSSIITSVNRKKTLLAIIVVLVLIASLRTAYEVYPKSSLDPINVVEDGRLGSEVIYKVGDFMTNYYKTGEVFGDYAVMKRIRYTVFTNSQYTFNWLRAPASGKPLVLPYKSILVFSIAGITYPSIYQSYDDYFAAYNYSLADNIAYNNGLVLGVVPKGAG